MNPSLRLIAALGLAAVASTASAEGDATAGKVKFETRGLPKRKYVSVETD